MSTRQTAMHPPSIWRPLRSISAIWHQAIDGFRTRPQAAGSERPAATLPVHLRYDVGDIDCRQPPQRTGAVMPQQTTLESNWLRTVR